MKKKTLHILCSGKSRSVLLLKDKSKHQESPSYMENYSKQEIMEYLGEYVKMKKSQAKCETENKLAS